jgi:HEAT repeat protein
MSQTSSHIADSSAVSAKSTDGKQQIADALRVVFEQGGTFTVEVLRFSTEMEVRLVLNATEQYKSTSSLKEVPEFIQSSFRAVADSRFNEIGHEPAIVEILRLGETGDEQAISELCQILENAPDPEIRASAAKAIGLIAEAERSLDAD